MPFTRRLARPDDLPAIVDIYNSTVASRDVTADTEPVTVESRRAWLADHEPATRPLWVAEDSEAEYRGRIAGWLSFSNFYGRPAYASTAELSIYIHEGVRRRGLGRYLLNEAIDFAPAISIHTLLGFVFGHNLPSLRLFESSGFERWGTLPRVATLDGIERDLIIVGRRVA